MSWFARRGDGNGRDNPVAYAARTRQTCRGRATATSVMGDTGCDVPVLMRGPTLRPFHRCAVGRFRGFVFSEACGGDDEACDDSPATIPVAYFALAMGTIL